MLAEEPQKQFVKCENCGQIITLEFSERDGRTECFSVTMSCNKPSFRLPIDKEKWKGVYGTNGC